MARPRFRELRVHQPFGCDHVTPVCGARQMADRPELTMRVTDPRAGSLVRRERVQANGAPACLRGSITNMKEFFRKFAHSTAAAVGSPAAFLVGVLVVLVWGASGPAFRYSDTWQLVINTGTTIVTFLMVFLIQNTQNRDAKAMHLKLDELIRAVASARNRLVHLEDLSDADLEILEGEFRKLHERMEKKLGSADAHKKD
jgi:low affinity Fe/Cu permease